MYRFIEFYFSEIFKSIEYPEYLIKEYKNKEGVNLQIYNIISGIIETEYELVTNNRKKIKIEFENNVLYVNIIKDNIKKDFYTFSLWIENEKEDSIKIKKNGIEIIPNNNYKYEDFRIEFCNLIFETIPSREKDKFYFLSKIKNEMIHKYNFITSYYS